MSRRKTPAERAKVTGADVLHPGRHRGRNTGSGPPLGDEPEWMDDRQAAVWRMYRSEMPWLRQADRCLVEVAAVLRARLWSGGEVGVNALAQLRLCLSAMGGTPADVGRVPPAGDAENDDSAGVYFS